MSIEENKAFVHRYLSADANEIRNSKTEGNDAYHSPYLKVHSPTGDMTLTEYMGFMDTLVSAFPDCKYNAEDVIAEGDKVACRYSFTGTNKGTFMGIPPTGKSVKIEGMGIFRISGGKFVEVWYATDVMGMMQQLGAIPSQ